MNLHEEGWTYELGEILIGVIDGEGAVIFGQKIEVKFPGWFGLFDVLL